MDLYRIISELMQERDRLERIIQSLEGITTAPGKVPARPTGKRRGRKSMDGPARKEVSERMKLYWASRRKEKLKEQKEKHSEKQKHSEAASG
jgi:hypothetical protein